jgi:PilZ domain
MTDQSEPQPPQVENPRRGETRKKVLLSGRITNRTGDVSIDVAIISLSSSGARIRIPRGVGIPSCVLLIVLRTLIAYDAEVVWLDPPFAGLRFKRSFALGGALPDEYAHLKPL